MEILSMLKGVEFFKDVAEHHLQSIADIGTVKTIKKGETIVAENSVGSEFFIVTKGFVAINKNVAGGRKRNLSNLKPGDIFGELTLFDAQPRSADAEAVEDVEIVEFPNAQFMDLLNKNPTLATVLQGRIIRVLCKRLRETNELLNEGVIWGFKMDF